MNGNLYRFVQVGDERAVRVEESCNKCAAQNGQDCGPLKCKGGYFVSIPKDSDEYLTCRLRGEV